jgi:magnesium transporter
MILEPVTLKAYREELIEALEQEDYFRAREVAYLISDGRIAQILKDSETEKILPFLEKISSSKSGMIISMLPVEMSAEILVKFGAERAAAFLDDVPIDSAVDIINLLPDEFASEVLNSLSAHLKESINRLREYDPKSVGAYMNTLFVGVKKGATIEETLTAIHDAPAQVENRSYIFIVNDLHHLEGVISIKDLIREPGDKAVDSIMNPDVVAVHADDDALDAAQLMRNRRFQMLPVLNGKDELTGVFLLDDAIRLLSENIVDQFVSIGAASADESFYTPPLGSVKKRLPWMAANVFLNLGAVVVISSFEGTIEAVAALAIFLPMITDMGGNVGIQALSVSIRSIALGEVRLSEYWRASKKEIVVGLINGLSLGLLFSIIALILRGDPVLGAVAGTALAVNVFVAGIVGGTLPFFIKRLGYDPAMMTGPVLTTITDITGVTIYLGLSTIFLANLLGA